MPYFDEHGNEVEGLQTEEEVNKKLEDTKAEAEATYAKEKEEGETKVTDLEKERDDAKEALEKAKEGDKPGDSGDKDENMANLRKKLDDTTEALDSQKKENEERWTKVTDETLNKTIETVAGEDKELAEKVKHHYDTTLSGVKAETPTEVREKVANALRLAAKPGTVINPMDVALSGQPGGPGSGDGKNEGDTKFTPEEKTFGAKLGVTDDDYKKYGNDPRLKK